MAANLNINHDLHASAIRKSQGHSYLYGVGGLGGRASKLMFNGLDVPKYKKPMRIVCGLDVHKVSPSSQVRCKSVSIGTQIAQIIWGRGLGG